MAIPDTLKTEDEQQYYETAGRIQVKPGWLQGEGQPLPVMEPYLWRWAEVEPLVMKSGELVTPDRDVERRTLRLATPGLDRGTTHTITAALQLLLPGENAPAHRHTPTAIRWILKGTGAYTTVEGDKCYMEPGDLVLTPSWTWHDHNNEGDEPMVWLDGLDVPLVRYLRANFYEAYPEDQQPIVGVAESERKFASGSLRPAWEEPSAPYSALWHYKWDKTYEALHQLAKVDASPFDDVAMGVQRPNDGRAGAADDDVLGADDPAGHCHAGAPADQLRGVPSVQGRGAQRHRRQAVRLDRGRLLRGAAVGLARARQ